MNERELTGRDRTHVVQDEALRAALSRRAWAAFRALRSAAAKRGFALAPLSGFRDFPAQARIWNRKFRGEAPLFDARGGELARAALAPDRVIDAILAWSALPGASRHHWGTDVDVYDAARAPDRRQVKLLPEETEPGGPFHELALWLTEEMAGFGFFRPYDLPRGGFNPEPWHLSFAEESIPALAALSPEVVARALREEPPIEGLAAVRARLAGIHADYVLNVATPSAVIT